MQPSFPGECPRVLGFGAGERALAALSVFFANSRWLRIGHARLAFFWWFCVGRGLLYCCFCKLALGANSRMRVKCSFCEFASGAHWPLGVLCVFCEFALGACLRTCVGHVRVGCVLGMRVLRYFTNLRRAHTGHLASCVFFVNLRWARV